MASHMNPDTDLSTAPKPKKQRSLLGRIFKWLLILLVVIFLLVLISPWILSMGWMKTKVEGMASEQLGVPVTIDDYSFSWFSGFDLGGLKVQNPEGFPQDHALLALAVADADVGFWNLFRGKVDVTGNVKGMNLHLDQLADGQTNVQALMANLSKGKTKDSPEPDEPAPEDESSESSIDQLDRVRLDFNVEDAVITLSQNGTVAERIEDLDVQIDKEFDTLDLKLVLNAVLADLSGGNSPGMIDLTADVDASMERPAKVHLVAKSLDLSKYRPLVASFVGGPSAISAFAGVINGTIDADVQGAKQVQMTGELVVEGPHFSGELFQGMNIQAPRWTIQPGLNVKMPEGKGLPTMDASGLRVDLGFATMTGLGGESLTAMLAGKPGIGASYTVDLGKVIAFGGPIPADLAGAQGRVEGTLALPIDAEAGFDMDALMTSIASQADVVLDKIGYAGFELAGLNSKIEMGEGKFSLNTAEGATLNQGPFGLNISANLANMDTVPVSLGMKWDGGKVNGAAADVLKYAIPLLAGFDESIGTEFSSLINFDVQLDGPAMPGGQDILPWLNQWTGKGNVGLEDGTLVPAAAFGQLLNVASFANPQGMASSANAGGQSKGLSFESLATAFSISEGSVSSNLMKLSSKGADINLSGSTGLDGSLDWTMDLRDLFKGHRDGERLIASLGDDMLGPKLGGTLLAPQLALPDLTSALKQAGLNALENAAGDAIKNGLDKVVPKEAKDILKQIPGLGGLPGFGGTKKKDGED